MFADLYQEIILEHYRRPQNVGVVEDGIQAQQVHASCGDKATVSVRVEGDRIVELKFVGTGCSISQASLSMMTEALRGKTLDEVRELYHKFRSMLRGEPPDEELLGDMVALQGVRQFPARVPCATLGWEALASALKLDESGR